MAKQNSQSTSSVETNTFDNSLVEDINDFHLPKNVWTQARNVINNSRSGDLGKLGNEPGNQFCARAPYTIIGGIHLQLDSWLIFSTNDTDSEIGIFSEESCTYNLLVNDRCLNFSTKNLIIGVSKPSGECTIDAYWEDARNPSRFLRVNTKAPYDLYVPWIEVCTDSNGGLPGGCITCVPFIDANGSKVLDCDKIRLAPLVKAPCLRVEKGLNGGTMLNGSYFVVAAYVVNGVKVTDYSVPSNVQSLFEHDNEAGSLDIFVEFTDDRFDEYELVLISTINQQTVARRVGIYSVRQTKITLDIVNDTWISVPIAQIPLLNAVVDKADAIYTVQDYLVRVGPTNKFDFNYQPFANQIVTKWQSVEYPADYYRKGGHNTGYLRDEVYSLFIRWVYDTGDKSNSYHIPGRPKFATDTTPSAEYIPGYDAVNERWVAENTATVTGLFAPGAYVLPDGGNVLAEGYMGYWESTEFYPDTTPVIWNAGVALGPYPATNNLDYNLCGLPIRHHKMPDNGVLPQAHHIDLGGNNIRILGLAFENIKPPLDNNGNLIPNIVGYEILRGSRQGNRSIIAKGIVNNMGLYGVEGNITPRTGAYANYPYNDINPDPFLSTTETAIDPCNFFGNGSGALNYGTFNSQSNFSNSLYSFHSPDTNFTHPFLAVKEVKRYGRYYGYPVGKFEFSEKHPKEKLITNLAFLTGLIGGLGIAYIAMHGQRTTQGVQPHGPGYSLTGLGLGGYGTGTIYSPSTADSLTLPVADGIYLAGDLLYQGALLSGANLANILIPAIPPAESFLEAFNTIAENTAGTAYRKSRKDLTQEDGKWTVIPAPLQVGTNIPTFFYYLSEGTDSIMRLIKAILRYRDFGLKYNSHCFYSGFDLDDRPTNLRREINQSAYIGPNIQDFSLGYRINNQYRSDFVALDLLQTWGPITHYDNSRDIAIGNPVSASRLAFNTLEDPTKFSFSTASSCAYVGLKQRIRNQYGQLNSISQMPVTACVQYIPGGLQPNQPIFVGNSTTMFNGDIYIGRYTEKNTFFYFYEWLFDQPDGYEFDYLKHRMLLYPTYWANFENFETQDFISGLTSFSDLTTPTSWTLPDSLYCLDGSTCSTALQFAVKNAWFYLFNSGVRDFFIESEINIDQRDWGNTDSEKHFEPYLGAITDVKTLFDTSIIKSRNYYKYDFSLSVSKTYLNYTSWGFLQLISYDPYLAETCYMHRPKRVIYSLPGNFESSKDFWRIFLPLNYKDFIAQVTCIKPINKSGAMIFFDAASPVQFQGTDQLETGLGTKLTIGDGALFSQPMQSVVNTDDPYEYASCQNRLSVINTPAGLFWISQNQGKIYKIGGGSSLRELSSEDLRWWFSSYLPYKLTEDFPDFDLIDNAVAGIACQSIYDNENGLVYFCKKDYELRKDITDVVTYDVATQTFMVNGILPIQLGDSNYFNDASWTISYDPKIGDGEFLGYHDWHPDLLLPTRNTFMTISKAGIDPNNPNAVRTNGIWKHNFRCDLYCNYYGIDYPFEVEWNVHTAQTINTLRSIEYYMEAYKYAPNCYDRYQLLFENFDEAVIYNTEQCSGLLKLELTPRNNLPLLIQYPIINFTNIQILYSKVENKYRFNMFWDITRERGGQEVGIPGVPAFAQQMIWNTPANGYAKTLNANNMNYDKAEVQRKKFRHYTTTVLLRKLVSGNAKMMVMLTDNKNLYSPR